MENIRKMKERYEAGLRKLSERKLTRKNDLILNGVEDLPIEFMDKSLSQENLYSVVDDDGGDPEIARTTEPRQPEEAAAQTRVQDMEVGQILEQVSSSQCHGEITGSVSPLSFASDKPNRPNSNVMETIEEEVTLCDNDKNLLLELIREILGAEAPNELELTDLDHGFELLHERLGVTLDRYDPDVMQKVMSICQSKRVFSRILTDQGVSPKPSQPSSDAKHSTPGLSDKDQPISTQSNTIMGTVSTPHLAYYTPAPPPSPVLSNTGESCAIYYLSLIHI